MSTEIRAPSSFDQIYSNSPSSPPAHGAQAISPPSKASLKSWWKNFREPAHKASTDHNVEQPPGIFGVPLRKSITYANVAISLIDGDGKSYIYGYVPIVVAKCGVYLKERATTVEGIFRLSGSEKRIKELKTIFDSPDRYGKGLDWEGYTVHDAANVLRRYLNQLPEPIVPLDLYDRFRAPLNGHIAESRVEGDGPLLDEGFDFDSAITIYQRLIMDMPPLNRQLLLYILDLLAVFASKSDENRMNAQNLSAIFQPGIISHPNHDMAPHEYRLSQDVLIFLIENQDQFLIGMRGTAADEQTVEGSHIGRLPSPTPIPISTPTSTSTHTFTVKGCEARSPSAQISQLTLPETSSNKSPSLQSLNSGLPSPGIANASNRLRMSLARSASNAGVSSARRYGELRRNLSVSSTTAA